MRSRANKQAAIRANFQHTTRRSTFVVPAVRTSNNIYLHVPSKFMESIFLKSTGVGADISSYMAYHMLQF
jgi:hypothetical protein